MAKQRKHIRMSEAAEAQLSEMAAATGRNQTEIIQEAISLLYLAQGDEVGTVREVSIDAPLSVLREVSNHINAGEEFDTIGTAVQLQCVPVANGIAFALFVDPAILEAETGKLVAWWQAPREDEE